MASWRATRRTRGASSAGSRASIAVVHVVPLTRLAPGTTYWFVAGDPTSGFSEERSFRTLPDDGSPVSFVAGGDMSTGWLPRLTSWQAARTDPSFALLGGDLAYCRGGPEGEARWQQWFADWEASMRTPDGRLIPLVAAIGNHDRKHGRGNDPAEAGALLHGLPLPGSRRTQLLRAPLRAPGGALRARLRSPGAARGSAARLAGGASCAPAADVPVRFALYHVALFPARQPIGNSVEAGRKHWLPLFDAFRLTAAFEHHGHLHKRTLPLRAGAPVADGTGTVFFGDGNWGKSRCEAREARARLPRRVASRAVTSGR